MVPHVCRLPGGNHRRRGLHLRALQQGRHTRPNFHQLSSTHFRSSRRTFGRYNLFEKFALGAARAIHLGRESHRLRAPHRLRDRFQHRKSKLLCVGDEIASVLLARELHLTPDRALVQI